MPDLQPQMFRVWTAMYCRWDTEVLPRQDAMQAVAFLRAQSESGDSRRRQFLELVGSA